MLDRLFVALRRFGFGDQRTIPSLDGLRAISIAFVLFSHLCGTRYFPGKLSPLCRAAARRHELPRIGQSALRCYRQNFTPEHMLDGYMRLYNHDFAQL